MGGDRREGFERLWREEYPRVFRTAYLIVLDREEAADLTQEAFTRAYERWRSVERMHNPAAWLQRVVGNLAISWRRRRRVAAEFAARTPPADVASVELADAGLAEALRALSPAQRAVVVLRYYADQSIDQTADALRKRPGTVKALAHQGLARLRQLLAEESDDEIRR